MAQNQQLSAFSTHREDDRKALIEYRPLHRKHPIWRPVLIFNLALAGSVLIMYSVFTAWVYSTLPISGGVAVVYSGSCSKSLSIVTYSRFLANAFATSLFAIGSYAAQLLLSPTRTEVDEAHSRGSWVHIGAPGFRNMRWIHKRRVVICFTLGLSFILLPFLHNSVMFASLATTDSMATLVTEGFLRKSLLDEVSVTSTFQAKAKQYQNVLPERSSPSRQSDYVTTLEQMQSNLTNLTYLSPSDCRSAYSSLELPSKFSNILLVASTPTTSTGAFISGDLRYPEMAMEANFRNLLEPVNWFNTSGIRSLFHDHCTDIAFDFGSGEIWNIPVWNHYCTASTHSVTHCLAQQFALECGVSINARVLVGVVICVLVEFLCLNSIIFAAGFRPLVTVGDAIADFLDNPDPNTVDKRSVAIKSVHSPLSRFDEFGIPRSEKNIASWNRKWPVWRSAVDTESCSLAITGLFVGFFAVATTVLIYFNDGTMSSYQPLTLRSPTSGHSPLSNLLRLGSIHLAVSVAYLLYNHLWSRMFAAAEISRHSCARALLRVSQSRGSQRSTYYLQIAPRFAVPMVVALALLHWLTGVSYHAVSLDIYDIAANYSRTRITFGVSKTAAILALAVALGLTATLAWALEQPLDPAMPVLGTSSVAISAACHADDCGSLEPVMYGLVQSSGRVGFSSRGVSKQGVP